MNLKFFDVLFDSDFYSFSRLVKDGKPYKVLEDKDKTILIHNVVGLGGEDIEIDIETIDDRQSYLIISGEKKDEDILEEKYNVKSRFIIKHNDIDHIEKYIKNGILKLEIYWKKQEKPNIEIINKN
jgi:HSP20 family molecular chaperone IbpA